MEPKSTAAYKEWKQSFRADNSNNCALDMDSLICWGDLIECAKATPSEKTLSANDLGFAQDQVCMVPDTYEIDIYVIDHTFTWKYKRI